MHGMKTLVASLALALCWPTNSVAQAPTYIRQWGSSGAGSGQFNQPIGIALDAQGNVYVSDQYNYRIQKFDHDGAYLTQFARGGTAGLAIDGSDLYAVNTFSSYLEKLSLDGTLIARWSTNGPLGGSFWLPWAVALDAAGNIYMSEVGNCLVRVLNSEGDFLRYVGGCGTGAGQFSSPYGIAVSPAGRVLVADLQNHRIQEFTTAGVFIKQWGSHGIGNGQFDHPYGLAIDSRGNVYVTDKGNHRVQVFSADGDYLAQWGSLGSGNGQFQDPTGIAVDPSGNVFVVDVTANRVQKFGPVPTSTVKRTWGALKAMYRGGATQ